MASVTMQCPQCGARKVIVEGEPYNQKDLVCAVDGKDLVIATTSSEPAPEPALFDEPVAEAAPVVEADAAPATEEAEPDPLTPEEMAKRLEKILALEKAVTDAQIRHERAHKRAKAAKDEVEEAQADLIAYIRDSRPKPLPLFDETKAVEEAVAEAAPEPVAAADGSVPLVEGGVPGEVADEPPDDAPEAGF